MASWLVLFAVAFSRLAFAAHEVEHDAPDHIEHCTVCAAIERDQDDDELPSPEATFAAPVYPLQEPPGKRGVCAAVCRTGYSPRASP